MGTRHLTCVKHDGKYKVAQYGQWDGYPSGQGVDALTFLRDEFKRDKFIERLNACRFCTPEELKAFWTAAGADDSGWCNMETASKFEAEHPQLYRDMGAGVLKFIQDSEGEVLLKDELPFAADGLFCEWVWVVDLDANTFGGYKGFNKAPLADTERFAFLNEQARKAKEEGDDAYYPPPLEHEWPLDALPSVEEFLKTMEPPEEENEEDDEGDEDGAEGSD